MKKTKFLIATAVLGIATFVAIAADHIDAPAVQGGTSDITDFYAFQGSTSSKIALVANVQGLLLPGDTGGASFDENVVIEFNIDTDGDVIQDIVIQAIPRDGKMYFFGPYASSDNGLTSFIGTTSMNKGEVAITPYGENAIIGNTDDMSFFAGPRDDPFFFDFDQYNAVLGGASGFNNPGEDKFAGTNVMSVVVEVPKSMIGGSGSINTWVETKRKQ